MIACFVREYSCAHPSEVTIVYAWYYRIYVVDPGVGESVFTGGLML